MKEDIIDLNARQEGSSYKSPGWWVVASRELSDLWFGGKLPGLLVLFSIFMGVITFLLATNAELSLIPAKEMVMLVLKIAISVSLLISLIIGANAISGEREAGTLESLLLTPVSRRQIIFGKFISALSPWPAIFLVSLIYMYVLSPNTSTFIYSSILGLIIGSLLVIITSGFGLLVSLRTNSNKVSLAVSLTALLLSLIPTQLPGTTQTGAIGILLKRINPMEASVHLLEKLIVNNRTIAEMSSWILSPVIIAVIILGLLFFFKYAKLGLIGGARE